MSQRLYVSYTPCTTNGNYSWAVHVTAKQKRRQSGKALSKAVHIQDMFLIPAKAQSLKVLHPELLTHLSQDQAMIKVAICAAEVVPSELHQLLHHASVEHREAPPFVNLADGGGGLLECRETGQSIALKI